MNFDCECGEGLMIQTSTENNLVLGNEIAIEVTDYWGKTQDLKDMYGE